MAPLPLPVAGGKLDALWEVVNVPEEDRPLVLAYLLECWRPETHFTVLELSGEQGSGKSDTQDRLRQLVDPSEVNLRAAPKTVEDVFVAAANNWLVSFNNLSHLTAAQQDALCTLSTGGGFAGRTLYTNSEETLIEAQRPVAMNGISTLATAQDLIDRTIRLELPVLQSRRRDSDLRAQFDQARPGILGALLDLFCATLRALPTVELENPPRMVDFATLGEAMFTAMGRADSFTDLYKRKRTAAVLMALESSPVACAVLAFVDRNPGGFSGSLKTLLSTLADYRQDTETWPRSGKGLADALRRNAPALRLAGVKVAFDPVRRMDGYHVGLKRMNMAHGGDTLFSAGNKSAAREVHEVHEVHEPLKKEEKTHEPCQGQSSCKVHGHELQRNTHELGNSEVHGENPLKSNAYEIHEPYERYPGNLKSRRKKNTPPSDEVHTADEGELF